MKVYVIGMGGSQHFVKTELWHRNWHFDRSLIHLGREVG